GWFFNPFAWQLLLRNCPVSRKKTGLKLSCHCRELCLCPFFECGKRHTWEKTMRKVRPEFSKLGGTYYDPSEQRRKLIEANERYRQRLKLALQAKLESTKGILGYIDGIAKVRDRYPRTESLAHANRVSGGGLHWAPGNGFRTARDEKAPKPTLGGVRSR